MRYARALSARLVAGLSILIAFSSLPIAHAAPGLVGAAISDDALGPQKGQGGRYRFKRSETCLMHKINDKRRARGLRRLDWDKQLGYVARQHAQDLASVRGLWHDSQLGSKITNWVRLGQNTGRGGRCARISRAFFNSSAHRANILGPFRFIGVGTQWAGRRLYVQQVFESRRDPGNVYRYP